MKMYTSLTPPTFVIPLNKQIYCFEISPYDASSNLFVAALQTKIVLGLFQLPVSVFFNSCVLLTMTQIKKTESSSRKSNLFVQKKMGQFLFNRIFFLSFQEDNTNEEFSWERLRELDQDTRSHAIAIAPDTSLGMLPKLVKFCTAGADFVVRIFRSNLDDSDTVQEVNRHTSYVNDVAWESSGRFLASVSDDHSCQIRSQHDDFKSEIVFRLKSPGVVVRWHPESPEKVLVAEKRGTIHIYNIESRQIVHSIETNKSPLMGADWNRNPFLVTALAAGEASVFDLRCP